MVVNRQPFLLADTMTYVRSADAAAFVSFGLKTDWTQRYHQRFDVAPTASGSSTGSTAAKPIIITGRSIYYGTFLYIADQLGGLRLAAITQAFLAVTCLLFTIIRFTRVPAHKAGKYLVILVSGLSFASTLAFFTSYLEPDLTCALAILASAHLIAARPLLDKWDRRFWAAVLFICVLMHSSTVLILIVITVCTLLAAIWVKNISKRGIALVATGILIAIAGEAIFEAEVYRHFGAPPVRPPFVMARLIADGPGKSYLEVHCPKAGFAMCKHLQSIASYDNLADSDAFLWSQDPSNGVFSAVDPDESRRIAAEETRFVLAVFKDRPFAVLNSSVSAVLHQLTKWHLSEFNVVPAAREQFAKQLPARIWQQQSQSLAFKQEMPVQLTEALTLPVALLSLMLILAGTWKNREWRRIEVFPAILLLGVAADIIICGAISTPHDRYLMRVIWLIPLAGVAGMLPQFVSRFSADSQGDDGAIWPA